MRTPPVQPLEDERLVTSRYRRTRTNLRGSDGSNDTFYEVQNWGNGRGGLDSEWERFHDAWKESYLTGSYFNSPGSYGGYSGGGYGGGGGYGYPGYGFPSGYPGYGGPGYGQVPGGGWPQQGGPPQNGPWNGNGPNGGWHGNGGNHGHQNQNGNDD